MSPLSSALRIVLVALGLVLVVAALKSEQWLYALGLACFFGVAFSSLSFSAIDRQAINPASSRWFLIAVALGAIGIAIGKVFFVEALVEGNIRSALRNGGALILVSFVVWKKREEFVSALKRGFQAFSNTRSESAE